MSIKKIAILVMIGVGALTTAIVVPIVVLSNKEDQKDRTKNIKIKEMKQSLNNLNLILPKGKDYSDETKILRAIKTTLENRTNIDASHTTFITSKPLANSGIALVAKHGATSTLFTIVVSDEEFILKLNQAQYTLEEETKTNQIKKSLSNLKVIIPKGRNYSNKSNIFEAVKTTLETRTSIDASHTTFITSKASANSGIASVAAHGATPTLFTILVGDQEFILRLNQAQYTLGETSKINKLKASLSDLELILSKGEDYNDQAKILEAIKNALKARVGINNSHTTFIISKTSANSGIASVATHRESPTLFTIFVGGQEFILKLNQAQYTLGETSKINNLKASLSDLDLILPKDENYNDQAKILEAIKISLKARVGINNSHTTFITSKASANSGIASVAAHGATPTLFTILVGDQEFILKLNQAQYNLEEKTKIHQIKKSLSNLNLILPKGENYSNGSLIFEAIKNALKKRVGIENSHIAFITSKTLANSGIATVAEYLDLPTSFTIIVDGKEFILQLNQAQYDANDIAKISELKNSLNNLKLILPKNEDYSDELLIFKAIKVVLKTRFGLNDSHIFYLSFKYNSGISSVAAYGKTPTLFTVGYYEEEFTLKLNQAQYDANDIAKISELKNSLNNLKLILPKDEDYSNESNILEAIKTALKARDGIDDSHIAFITSKALANSGISSVAAHEESPTLFTIIVDGEEFILKLNQAQYTLEEIKINELKNSLSNLNVTLPKNEDYSNESNILEAIKTALKARDGIDDSHIAFITSKALANSGISSVAADEESPTLFTIIVDGEEFILKLNQAQYTLEEIKINELKNSLSNLNVTLPKNEDYSNESNILEAIKTALKARDGIDDSHIAFITSKALANSGISSVAADEESPTLFTIIVDAEEFILKLNQAKFDTAKQVANNLFSLFLGFGGL